MILNEQGDITKGNLIQYISSTEPKQVPKNTFSKILNYQNLDCDGQFTVLRITDDFRYELKFENGKLKSVAERRSKNSSGNQRTNDSCIKYFKNIILKFGGCCFLSVILLYCGVTKRDNSPQMRVINLIHHLQLVNTDDGKLLDLIDTLNIFYNGDIIIYAVPHSRETSNLTFDKKGNQNNEKLLKRETLYTYFIYKKNDSLGFKYDSISDSRKKEFAVDSFLNLKAFRNAVFYSKNDSLIETISKAGSNILIEKYIPKIKYDESYNDTTYFYFTDKLTNIDYSFSRELDSIKNLKLVKVRFIFNPVPKGLYPFGIPRRELLFEIKEVSLNNPDEILNLFTKFKKDYSNN
jgi:hypothetical protein